MTSTLSNLGVVTLPESMGAYVSRFDFILGPPVKNMLCCAVCTFGGRAVISFSSVMEEADIERFYFRHLAREGLDVVIETNYGVSYEYCKNCALKVNTPQALCPLCASDLSDAENAACAAYPEEDDGVRPDGDRPDDGLYPANSGAIKYDLTFRIFLFLSVLAVGGCVLINILAYDGILWS